MTHDPQPPPAANRSAQAYQAISQMIRQQKLRAGERVVEAKLAEMLGVSRTPMREALQRLEGEGMVVKTAHRSYAVRQVDLAEYLHSLRVREALEPEAAALAVGRIDPERMVAVGREIEALQRAAAYHTDDHWRSDDNLHELFLVACGNPVMARIIRGLRAATRLFEATRLADRLGADNSEHLEILAALKAEDAKRVRRALQTHLRSLHRFALDHV